VVILNGFEQRFKTFGELGKGEKSNVQLGRFLRFDQPLTVVLLQRRPDVLFVETYDLLRCSVHEEGVT